MLSLLNSICNFTQIFLQNYSIYPRIRRKITILVQSRLHDDVRLGMTKQYYDFFRNNLGNLLHRFKKGIRIAYPTQQPTTLRSPSPSKAQKNASGYHGIQHKSHRREKRADNKIYPLYSDINMSATPKGSQGPSFASKSTDGSRATKECHCPAGI